MNIETINVTVDNTAVYFKLARNIADISHLMISQPQC